MEMEITEHIGSECSQQEPHLVLFKAEINPQQCTVLGTLGVVRGRDEGGIVSNTGIHLESVQHI